jgi:hypothetical protein
MSLNECPCPAAPLQAIWLRSTDHSRNSSVPRRAMRSPSCNEARASKSPCRRTERLRSGPNCSLRHRGAKLRLASSPQGKGFKELKYVPVRQAIACKETEELISVQLAELWRYLASMGTDTSS